MAEGLESRCDRGHTPDENHGDLRMPTVAGHRRSVVIWHLNPMTALAWKLQMRGHEVSFIGVPDARAPVRAAGLNFICYCENEYPPGSDLYAPTRKLQAEPAPPQ
jgi:hypothetical protein